MTEKGRNRAEIVYEDNSSICPLLVVIHSISVSADWFSATGKAFSSENRLLLEVPEYTTFKDGDVLSSKDGSYIFILNTHGKYLTSFYASLAAGKSLNISDNLAAHENHIECYRFATDSEKQKMIKALKKSKNPKAIVQLLDDDSREESGSGTYYERECDALFDIDGRGNTERLVARNPKLRNLLEDGEYIPSLGQLNLMAHYMDELNKAFTYVSASPLSSTWYWSSTESGQAVAWYVVFSSGLTGTGNKHIGDMVRTVIDF